jgi:hypothetical protein
VHRLENGYHRQWIQCNECAWVGFHDFTKDGLGNPLSWLGCGHGLTRPIHLSSREITATEAQKILGRRVFDECQRPVTESMFINQ